MVMVMAGHVRCRCWCSSSDGDEVGGDGDSDGPDSDGDDGDVFMVTAAEHMECSLHIGQCAMSFVFAIASSQDNLLSLFTEEEIKSSGELFNVDSIEKLLDIEVMKELRV